jgi:hypothetical protein
MAAALSRRQACAAALAAPFMRSVLPTPSNPDLESDFFAFVAGMHPAAGQVAAAARAAGMRAAWCCELRLVIPEDPGAEPRLVFSRPGGSAVVFDRRSASSGRTQQSVGA